MGFFPKNGFFWGTNFLETRKGIGSGKGHRNQMPPRIQGNAKINNIPCLFQKLFKNQNFAKNEWKKQVHFFMNFFGAKIFLKKEKMGIGD